MNAIENMNLLLVDDEADFRAPLKKRLEKRKFHVLEAGNGEECQSILKNTAVSIVVLDVKMPGMSGIEVMEWIKKNYPATEVILLTGHASTIDGVEGIKKGAFDYLTKPIDFDHLVQKIFQAAEKIKRDQERLQEKAFKEKMEQQMVATERLASLGTLSTGIAHEIDNPLAIIKESAEYMKILLNKEELSQMSRRNDFENAISKIETAIERAKRITHQLLGFVKKQETCFAETDLNLLIAETIEFVGKEAQSKGILIVDETRHVNGVIWSDPYKIRQILFNLLNNAIQASGPDQPITISIAKKDSAMVLSIADTGEGIPKENLKKIFEPFFTTKAPGVGTGLGLYVTRGIVEQLGGTITLESRVGAGTCFDITLPICRDPDAEITDDKNICLDILNKIKGDNAK